MQPLHDMDTNSYAIPHAEVRQVLRHVPVLYEKFIRLPSAAPPQPKVHGATRGEGGAALSSVGSLQPAAVTAAVFATRTANIKQLLAKAA